MSAATAASQRFSTAPEPTGPAGSGPPLRRLICAECSKIVSTYAVWGLLGAALLLCGLGVISPIVTARDDGLDLGSADAIRTVFSAIGGAEIPALALGILASAGEFRHGMAELTFLAVPQRGRMLAAKAVALALAGAAIALACAVLAVAVALPWLAAKHASPGLFDGELWRAATGATAATALYGVLGVAVGYLIRGLAAALVIAIVWFLAVESAILALWDDGGRYLPGGGASGMARSTAGNLLGQGASALLLAGWVAAFLALACWQLRRKDIAS